MQIIPSTPYQNGSSAESKVFYRIRNCFVSDNSHTAFHSLNLTRHESKRFGEADFVLVNSFGLFVLEVKGGRVNYQDGQWITVNREDQICYIQDPFKQASGAMHGIAKAVGESGDIGETRLAIGYGVVFPDVEWNSNSSEWDRATICDLNDFRHFEKWLRRFFSYWRTKPGNDVRYDSKQLDSLKQFLRPEFELVEPLYHILKNQSRVAVKLTEDQYKYVDIAEVNNRVLCYGGAGTGKTFLAAELARRLGNKDKQILFLCKSNWLRQYLSTLIKGCHLTFSTINSVKLDKKRKRIRKFDVLIVDEGQDLFNFNDLDNMDSLLTGGLKAGEWYIFHDVNNQVGLFEDENKGQVKEVLAHLKDCSPVNIPLTTNCRNTFNILDTIQSSLQCDVGNTGTGEGPKTEEFFISIQQRGEALEKLITKLLNQGAKESSITILSPKPYSQSSVALLPKDIGRGIQELDEYSVRSFPPAKMSFSEIKNFKGLENDVVIVVDLAAPKSIQKTGDKTQHYVAMSRARGLLCSIWIKDLGTLQS
ncbi:nuclease-related domain-containing DEAD/DEAH box helicase [Desulforhopalus sp. 52FAK]